MNGYNGYTHRGQDSFDAAMPSALRPSPTPSRPPTTGAYSHDSSYSFGQEDSRFALMDADRAHAPIVDLKDPVQVHLLTETALLDSKEFEILSQEEADALKKRCQALNQRIEQTRSNLAIQSKYRDAAISMSKLYSTGKDSARRSLLGGRSRADSDAAREAEAEREATQKKCDDLTAELRSLEKRAMEPKRRLLEHTAGILQFAHKKAKKPSTPAPKVPLVNGVPASPESMYTTSNGRNSLEPVDDFFIFDQGSLYQSFDQLDLYGGGGGVPRTSPLEIPAKSPSRENKLLTDENDKLRQENDQLRAQMDSLAAELDGFRGGGSNQDKLITDTELKLERLNNQLREQIMNADPANENYTVPPSGQLEPGDMIGSHLDYLENGLYALSEIPRNSNPVDEFQSDRSDAILRGLWEKIQSGYAEIRQRKLERRKARLDKGMEVEEEDVSEGESFDADEVYSLVGFESRVQWLYQQATGLREQKEVLQRQIKQQRELNSRSDSEKDEAYRAKVEELEQAQQALMNAEGETDMVRQELSQALEDLNNQQRGQSDEAAIIDEAQAALRVRNQKIASLEGQLKEVQPRLAAADANIEAVTAQLQQVNDAKEAAEKAAAETQAEAASRQKELEEKQKELEAKHSELAEVTGMVAELKMEAALAKAELDGAYGSRSERAAAAAAKWDSSEEGAAMKNRVDALEKELRGTAKDLADVVQQSLEYEGQMRKLEAELDKVTAERARLRDERERAAAELDRATREAATDAEERLGSEIARLRKDRDALQEELDGERLKSGSAPPLSPGGKPRTSYLTEQYRTGLRAERRRYEESMKTELMARRKIEEELRALKKAQGGGAGGAGAGSGVVVTPLRSPSALSPPPR